MTVSVFVAGSLSHRLDPAVNDQRRPALQQRLRPYRHTRGVTHRALTTMTTLAEPALIITTATPILEPATPATSHPRQRSTTVDVLVPARPS